MSDGVETEQRTPERAPVAPPAATEPAHGDEHKEESSSSSEDSSKLFEKSPSDHHEIQTAEPAQDKPPALSTSSGPAKTVHRASVTLLDSKKPAQAAQVRRPPAAPGPVRPRTTGGRPHPRGRRAAPPLTAREVPRRINPLESRVAVIESLKRQLRLEVHETRRVRTELAKGSTEHIAELEGGITARKERLAAIEAEGQLMLAQATASDKRIEALIARNYDECYARYHKQERYRRELQALNAAKEEAARKARAQDEELCGFLTEAHEVLAAGGAEWNPAAAPGAMSPLVSERRARGSSHAEAKWELLIETTARQLETNKRLRSRVEAAEARRNALAAELSTLTRDLEAAQECAATEATNCAALEARVGATQVKIERKRSLMVQLREQFKATNSEHLRLLELWQQMRAQSRGSAAAVAAPVELESEQFSQPEDFEEEFSRAAAEGASAEEDAPEEVLEEASEEEVPLAPASPEPSSGPSSDASDAPSEPEEPASDAASEGSVSTPSMSGLSGGSSMGESSAAEERSESSDSHFPSEPSRTAPAPPPSAPAALAAPAPASPTGSESARTPALSEETSSNIDTDELLVSSGGLSISDDTLGSTSDV
eukprot:gnl/Chilomastix_cuspidata/471.p1 GENE.gnl/Chilomastix_cuspidata/471~~gnl/Chilomastix_cuspidata/471.p1  ORF type:complete len:603 (-),score=258.77 gnl/Chilomastix_cuspidata/471:778-2586(-)